MIIRAEWETAEKAAAIANTVREVFLENHLRMRRAEFGGQIRDLEGRLEKVRSQLKEADTALQEFTTSHKIVDLDKQATWNLDELTSINILLEKSQVEEKKLSIQAANIDPIIADLKRRVAEERQSAGSLGSFSEMDFRMRELRSAIRDDKGHRAAVAVLAEKELQFEQAKKLVAQDLISKAEYEKARTEYERQKDFTLSD